MNTRKGQAAILVGIGSSYRSGGGRALAKLAGKRGLYTLSAYGVGIFRPALVRRR